MQEIFHLLQKLRVVFGKTKCKYENIVNISQNIKIILAFCGKLWYN